MLLFITVNCTNYSHKAFFYLYSSDVRIIDDRIKKKVNTFSTINFQTTQMAMTPDEIKIKQRKTTNIHDCDTLQQAMEMDYLVKFWYMKFIH